MQGDTKADGLTAKGKYMKWSVGTKIAAAFTTVLVILIAIGTRSFLSTDKMADTSRMVDHTHHVLEDLEKIISRLKDAETGQRGYVITGDEKYLEPYNTAVPLIDPAIDDVKQLTSDNPRQGPRADLLPP